MLLESKGLMLLASPARVRTSLRNARNFSRTEYNNACAKKGLFKAAVNVNAEMVKVDRAESQLRNWFAEVKAIYI